MPLQEIQGQEAAIARRGAFRIAPTPSGFLHIGNAFNFILTALLARHSAASLRLRIDDVDAPRVRPEYLRDIFDTLNWLGIEWNDGPRDTDDHTEHFSQSLRTARYAEMFEELAATGLVFACDCSRKDIHAADPAGNYPGTCYDKGLPLNEPDTALRLRTPEDVMVSFTDELLGVQELHPFDIARDPIIRRRDGLAAYHIASITDDLDSYITGIVRGADLMSTTAVQLYISRALGGTIFDRAVFYHHPLLENELGAKLSKSAGSDSLFAMRDQGVSATGIYQRFSGWMGWPAAANNFSEAAELFASRGLGELKRKSTPHGFAE
jgi:glutamyl-tRNA synthetase